MLGLESDCGMFKERDKWRTVGEIVALQFTVK